MPETLTEVLARYGHQPVKQSRDEVWYHCPFHADKKPSFHVSLKRQGWYCFPCGEGGGRIKLLARLDGISYDAAKERDRLARGIRYKFDPFAQQNRTIEKYARRFIKWILNHDINQNRLEAIDRGRLKLAEHNLFGTEIDLTDELKIIKETSEILDILDKKFPDGCWG